MKTEGRRQSKRVDDRRGVEQKPPVRQKASINRRTQELIGHAEPDMSGGPLARAVGAHKMGQANHNDNVSAAVREKFKPRPRKGGRNPFAKAGK